jgi:hypothetical protein
MIKEVIIQKFWERIILLTNKKGEYKIRLVAEIEDITFLCDLFDTDGLSRNKKR